MHNTLDINNNVAVILMRFSTIFLLVFGFIAVTFSYLAVFIYSKIDKEKEEERLKKKFFIED